jgi:hypothetical protein
MAFQPIQTQHSPNVIEAVRDLSYWDTAANIASSDEYKKLYGETPASHKDLNWYTDKYTLASRVSMKADPRKLFTSNRVNPDPTATKRGILQNYVSEEGKIDWQTHFYKTEHVTRNLGNVTKLWAWEEGIIQKVEEQNRLKLAPEKYAGESKAMAMDEYLEARLKDETEIICHKLRMLASQPSLFSGSADLLARDFVNRGATIVPTTYTTDTFIADNVLNTTINDALTTAQKNDVAVNPDTFLKVLQRLTDKYGTNGSKGAGVLYLHKNATYVIQALRTEKPELFDKDFDKALPGGLIPNYGSAGTMEMIVAGVKIKMIDDLVNTTRVYGTSALDTYYLLNATVDTRNLFGIYLVNDVMPIVGYSAFQIQRSHEDRASDTELFVWNSDYIDEDYTQRGNVVAIDSMFRHQNIDYTRGNINNMY